MIPDAVSDELTDVARLLGVDNLEQVLYRAAKEHGDNDAHGSAVTAYFIWCRQGYTELPDYVKDFCLHIKQKHLEREIVLRLCG